MMQVYHSLAFQQGTFAAYPPSYLRPVFHGYLASMQNYDVFMPSKNSALGQRFEAFQGVGNDVKRLYKII